MVTNITISEEVPTVEKPYQIVLPADQLVKAGSAIGSITSNALSEEDIWRLNILLFLDNNSSIINFANNTTF